MKQHTPGPWKIQPWPTGRVEIVSGTDDAPMAEVWGDDSDPNCWPITANAKLMAAAPDLLEALDGLNFYGETGNGFCCCARQNWQDEDSLHSSACADARRAIKKAREKS